MKNKFQNKYRSDSIRLKNWDYSSNAAYFFTICSKNRECYFGNVMDTHNLRVSGSAIPEPRMQLSEIGRVSEKFWTEIPDHFPFAKLGEFIVMPNHMHGIIIIDKPRPSYISTEEVKNREWKSGTLGVIINQYKRICTINARKINVDFGWQRSFYDHIIRNEKSFQKISNYIRNNPLKWNQDKFHV